MKPIIFQWERAWAAKTDMHFPLSGASVSRSRTTGTTRASATMNTPWQAKMTFERVPETRWRPMVSLLMRLDTAVNQVRLYDHASVMPLGKAAGINRSNYFQKGTGTFTDGTKFTDGTGFRDGSTKCRLGRNHRRGDLYVLLTGLVPSQNIAIENGDAMEIGGYFHKAVARCRSDSQGRALVPIYPAIRIDIVAGSSKGIVNFAWPTSPFVLATPFEGAEISAPFYADSFSPQFVEVLP